MILLMTHAKIGDFILLTPQLQWIQQAYPETTIAVPDRLWPLYREQKVFPRSISQKNSDMLPKYRMDVLDLTFPLLDVKVPDNFKRLASAHFKKNQHATKSYTDALRDFFPRLPFNFEVKPILDLNSKLILILKNKLQSYSLPLM